MSEGYSINPEAIGILDTDYVTLNELGKRLNMDKKLALKVIDGLVDRCLDELHAAERQNADPCKIGKIKDSAAMLAKTYLFLEYNLSFAFQDARIAVANYGGRSKKIPVIT